ncbi:glycosyltransferase family 4 protein [Neobacillus mesonae]|uniref:glycosyltransferase n=1 Tax=Neobacillus mesonae TaxID=1193713 RepID=UPI00203B1591|nr:glycosyltransferase family 4 protein [Neobacillus mesonae]MCM3569382.1 glycosyltransferase family 4 protein [Neobacillus mesonae]
MKILFITNKLPFPANDGRKNILMQYIQTIKEIDKNIEVINASFVDDEKYLKNIPTKISKVKELKRPSFLEKIFNILFYSLILRQWPLQVSLYYSRKTNNTLLSLIKNEHPTHIIYDMVRVAPYIPKNFSGKLIMNYDDLLSLRYSRQIKYIDYIPSILGGVASNFPKSVQHLISGKWIQKQILKFESALLKKYEIKIATKFNSLIFTSPKEAKSFKEQTKSNSCIGIPMSYEVNFNMSKRLRYENNRIVFVGKMDIPHNVAAVLYFCEKIFPLVREQNNNIEFHIIGKDPIQVVRELEKKYDGVKVIGPVDDLKGLVETSAVFVAPLVFGTGIKTKVIEALSYNVPVVSTSIGAEGISFSNGLDMFVTDNETEFANSILQLVSSTELNNNISSNGKKLVQKEFSKSAMFNKWFKVLKGKEEVSNT